MKDRLPSYPGRVTLTPVQGATNTYDMVRADLPTQEGTPLNASTLLSNGTAVLMGLGADATPNDMFAALAREVNNLKSGEDGEAIPIERGGTGATIAAQALSNLGITYGSSDLTADSSPLETGKFYAKYK